MYKNTYNNNDYLLIHGNILLKKLLLKTIINQVVQLY